jgi:hypothetical protein
MPDTPEDTSGRKAPRRYVRYSARLAHEVCARIAAGETQRAICAEAHMPSTFTLRRWARTLPKFARAFARARAMGGRDGAGPAATYDPVTAFEIVARMSEGESLTSICADPAMPCARTIFNWRTRQAEFEDELRIARAAAAERFADLGWTLAMEATPATAHLTRVRLAQLRWTCAILSPGTHGRLKPLAAPEPAAVQQVTLRTFRTEVNPETGQVRGVALHFDPEAGAVVREMVGAWADPPFPLRLDDPRHPPAPVIPGSRSADRDP